MLACWADSTTVAWYTLSEEDADAAVLARGLVVALSRHVPTVPAELIAAVRGQRGPRAALDEVRIARGYGSLLADALERQLKDVVTLVLDDFHEVGAGTPGAALVEELCREAPAQLRIVIASRSEPPVRLERLKGQGLVTEIAASALAFSPEETRAFAVDVLGTLGQTVADGIHQITGGWPVAVRLACEALRRGSRADPFQALAALHAPGGPLFGYLAGEVLTSEPAGVRDLLSSVAPLERFAPGLCQALGFTGADRTLRSLATSGLFVEADRDAAGWFRLTPLSREFLLDALPLAPAALVELHRGAARWLSDHGDLAAALRSLEAVGDVSAIASFLRDHGERLIADGAPAVIVRAIGQLTSVDRAPELEFIAGLAHQALGDWDDAAACYRRVASDGGELPAGVAWRLGLIHHLRGELDDADAAYARATRDGVHQRDEALLLAWRASLDWLRGDGESCRARAQMAYALATETDDPQALAAAHTALALAAALEGDRSSNSAHYERALEYADRAGDVMQTIRIRTNRGSRLLEEGHYEAARVELEIALAIADVSSFAALRSLALVNRGTVSLRLGRFEDAMTDLEAALTTDEAIGSLERRLFDGTDRRRPSRARRARAGPRRIRAGHCAR